MIFGFSMYGIASSIEIPFHDSPVVLTGEEEFWFRFADFGIRFFPVGLAGIVISVIGIAIRKKKTNNSDL